MTLEEAKSKSKEIWGEQGFIKETNGVFLVGTFVDGGRPNQATGLSTISWEDAFENAIKAQQKRRVP